MSDVLDDLQWRGLIALSTDEAALRAALSAGPIVYYCGFDPSAASLHVGNLVQILTLRRLQLAGHRPLALVGGATGLIGDPSGKSVERNLNDRAVVAGWVDQVRGQIEPYLDFDGPNAARMVNNLDWTAPLSAIDFLRDIGKHFPVNRMLGRESVSARLAEGGISYTEFSYQILQAMDYLELHRRYGCVLQSGGSDQWGNLTAGVDLIRRVTGTGVHALATPLITKPDGTKYGKTAGAAVWLDPEMMSPYAFYQFFINREDAEVGRLLRVFSFRSREEIEELEKITAERPAARVGQRTLAEDLTSLVHGADELAAAQAASRALFGQGELAALDDRTLAAAMAEIPGAVVGGAELPSVADLLADTGLVPSRSAARRVITEGGAYLNNVKVTSVDAVPDRTDLLHRRWLVLRRGKRNVAGVEVKSS
ncbi:MAG TPA: tyrosine--tRNA ligase [Actinomycetes bacterium]|nr:tyrosine--tRNA ligase [Actinomycetes bacterium]